MSLPSHVWLMTQRIGVEELEREPPEEGHRHEAIGEYDANMQVIRMDLTVGFDQQRDTFLHENLHAMINAAHLEPMMDDAMPGFTEHLVSVLSPLLLAWMRDNPHAVNYLMELPL